MIGELLALLGAVLVLLSAVGVVRFPEPLSRLHALAKASTLGVLLILAGAAANLRDVNDVTSVVLAGVLHLLASPPASNMISRAAYLARGLPAGAVDERARAGVPGAAGPARTDAGLAVTDTGTGTGTGRAVTGPAEGDAG